MTSIIESCRMMTKNIERYNNLTDEEVAKEVWCSHHHVKPNGDFLDIPYKDEDYVCPLGSMGVLFWNEDTPDMETVSKLSTEQSFTLRCGEIVTYYCPNETSIKYLVEHHNEKIKSERQKMINIEIKLHKDFEKCCLEMDEKQKKNNTE